MNFTDMTDYTDEELYALIQQIQNTIANRQTLKVFNTQLQRVYTDARDSGAIETPEPGDQWEQPRRPSEVYVQGDVVTDEGKTWESSITGNQWKPGVAGWFEVLPVGDDGEPQHSVYKEPVGYADAYDTGRIVWFPTEEDDLYKCIKDGTTWSPTEAPSNWELIEE